jgi:hypothetical protein
MRIPGGEADPGRPVHLPVRLEGEKVNDLILDRNYKLGDKGGKVKLIQEWLCLHGFLITINGDFGPATDRAVRSFQARESLLVDGDVGNNTFSRLIAPIGRALAPIPVVRGATTLRDLIVASAQQHLEQHPREVGGQNRGPWVRLYMDGNEGDAFAWCAGFAMYCLKQACAALGLPLPIEPSDSCDELARRASAAGLLLEEVLAQDGGLKAGSLFLVRRTPTDWTHVGIVSHVAAGAIDTIEGNTNDEGSREGYEVCARTRDFKNKDFIVWR